MKDDKYVVLAVPPLSPPSTRGDIGIIYQRNGLLSSIFNSSNLSYDNRSFSNIDATTFKVENKSAVLDSSNGHQLTLWSNTIKDTNFNYIEGRFRMIDENKTNQHNAGLVWDDGANLQYTFVTDKGLVTYNPIDNLALQNAAIVLEKGAWYTLKIAFMRNTTNIYVNDILQMKLPRNGSENSQIYKLGVSYSQQQGRIRTYQNRSNFRIDRTVLSKLPSICVECSCIIKTTIRYVLLWRFFGIF